MSSHNLVQELVNEMGPNNPALSGQPLYPMQQGMQPQPHQLPPQGMMSMPAMPQQPMQMYAPDMQQQPQQQQLPYMDTSYQQPEDDDENEMNEMMDLENYGMDGAHRSWSDRAMDQGREAFFLALLFFLLSLPQVDQFLQRMIPQITSSFYYLIAFKGLLLAVAYFVAKYFEII